jgi:multicomponent Na+:H+ antiporter subunit G
MIDYIVAIIVAVLLLSGSMFAFVAALGILRLPDLYTRMHAASKAGTVGSGLLLFAAGIESGEVAVFVRALAGFVFFILTAPVAAHLLARAAHSTGYRLGPPATRDDLLER